jgi:outer membrane murein-binding lipoprotein Lpp
VRTFGDIVDELAIVDLKIYHFKIKDMEEAVEALEGDAHNLREEITRLMMDAKSGLVNPQQKWRIRYHDHKDHESESQVVPDTIGGCISRLVVIHSTYWQLQTQVQGLKSEIDNLGANEDSSDSFNLLADFKDAQRAIDLQNQFRNDIVRQLDKLFAGMCE